MWRLLWLAVAKPFPDHDCERIEQPSVDWVAFRDAFSTKCSHSKRSSTLRCGAAVGNFVQIGQGLIDAVQAPGVAETDLRVECHLGMLTYDILLLLHAAQSRNIAAYIPIAEPLRESLRELPFEVYIGTRCRAV